MAAGQVSAGASLSTTVTVNVQVAVLSTVAVSVAVHVTVVVPFGKVVPDAGTQLTVAPGQLSATVGVVKLTVARHSPGVLLTVWFAGQPLGKVGAWLSTTVTVNVQGGVATDGVHVTVVTPF